MNQLQEKTISCPYCGESIDVLIEPSDMDTRYIEDCQVCCRPINFEITIAYNGELLVLTTAD